MEDNNKDKPKNNALAAISLGSQLGFAIAAPLVLCLFLGIFLDKKFNTSPLFLITLVIFSIIVTILDVYYMILPFIEKRSQKDNKDNKNKK
jgi:F0F1-type ATP synthase assembly protein I